MIIKKTYEVCSSQPGIVNDNPFRTAPDSCRTIVFCNTTEEPKKAFDEHESR